MTLADTVGVMSGPDRVRITKGRVELFAGYLFYEWERLEATA